MTSKDSLCSFKITSSELPSPPNHSFWCYVLITLLFVCCYMYQHSVKGIRNDKAEGKMWGEKAKAAVYAWRVEIEDLKSHSNDRLSIIDKNNLWYSFIPLVCAECDDSLPFSGASFIPLCYVLSPAPLLHQLFFHPLSPHLAIYFLVYPSILLFQNSYIIPFWEFYFLSFSVHAQANVISLTLLPLL